MPADMMARDTIIAWYRSEFAAANAIIDALCSHIVQINEGPHKYSAVFSAMHRRRMNWIPVLHMQRYFSISDVVNELRRVAENRKAPPVAEARVVEESAEKPTSKRNLGDERISGRISENVQDEYSSADSSVGIVAEEGKQSDEGSADIGGSQEEHTLSVQICEDHVECSERLEKIKISKGFVAKEPVKGHMVNVVKGLKLYEDMFTKFELVKLTEYINELRLTGRMGELSGETFIFFNKQMKGNKREILQLGVPLFQQTNEEASCSIEPIPHILLSVIDHLIQWRLIPQTKRPNSCIINFFDEDEFSQPYYKPPHLENPISTLFLSETSIAFGRALASNQNGAYKGALSLQLSQGSLLVMRGNSADMARHAICPSQNKRVSITFLKVRASPSHIEPSSPTSQQSKAITLWQPPPPIKLPDSGSIAYGPHSLVPVVMLATGRQTMFMGQGRRAGRGGTGVFLPWAVGPKRYAKHLPPRIQKRRLLSLPQTQ
ncbi:hypothetical protein HPP92_001204 [Vanilla planifolia]|uniref:Fe2OG dioxygenase domain-containing protein n=1 Tax=Vanilla planifolia TaxID=51239 RepID=A0A835SBI6_VANPL|nr:hypothetical protein HPP92_001204 [Vanilla planifolia]